MVSLEAAKATNEDHSDIAVARSVLQIEAEGLRQLSASLDGSFCDAVNRIIAAEGRVICVGIGKSGHVARKIASTLSSTGTAAYFVHPAEASHGDLGMIRSQDVVLALSRSGETSELDDIVQYARRFAVTLIAITADPDSALARAATITLLLPPAEEACAETKAPTTSTTMTMALGDALAVALLRRRGFDADKFKLFHPGGKLGAMLKTARDVMHGGDALPLVKEHSMLQAGLDEISKKSLGCVGVVDAQGLLKGLITDGDLRRFIARGKSAKTVNDVMTASPITAHQGMLAADVLQIMNDKKITQIFVVEDKRPIGIVHLHHILKEGLV